MSRGADVPPVLRTLLDAGATVLRASSAGRVAVARLGSALDAGELDPAARRRLDEALAQTCVPLDRRTVERELREAWDERPAAVLDELDPEPLAIRPAAQVHRGVLDGAPVAVKVRRPGLERAARGDLGLLDGLAPALGRLLGAADAGAVLREARERVLDELDLEHEAAGQRQVGRALRGMPGVRVPAVHTALCAPGVMVSELLEGPALDAPGAGVPDPAGLARTLLRVHLGLGRRAGIAPADPRPGHVLLGPDGTVGLLGLGVHAPVDRGREDALLAALRALRAGDAAAFDAAVARLVLLGAGEGAAVMPLVAGVLGELVAGPARLDAAALAALADRAARALDELVPLAGRVTLALGDLWPLRGLVQLAALLARLGLEEDWVALAIAAGAAETD
jgi:hypothetical protein